MVQKRDIDHVVEDPSFEVRFGTLTDLIRDVISRASQKTKASRVCEISGSTTLVLLLALLSVEKFKSFGSVTSDQIQGGVAMLFTIASIAFIISGIRVILARDTLPRAEQIVQTLIPSESNVFGSLLAQDHQVKLPHKTVSMDSGFYMLLRYLVEKQGAASRQDVLDHLKHDQGSNAPSEALNSAINSGFVVVEGDALSISREGMDYFSHIAEVEARHQFYGTNLEEDRTKAWRQRLDRGRSS